MHKMVFMIPMLKITPQNAWPKRFLSNACNGCISALSGGVTERNPYNRKIVKHIFMLTNFNRGKPAVALANANFVQLV